MKTHARKAETNVHPFFVIVHDMFLGSRDARENPGQCKEIKRIRKEEDFAEVRGRPQKIPLGMPRDRKILVCGAMGHDCVATQNSALKRAGYDAEIYKKATIYK